MEVVLRMWLESLVRQVFSLGIMAPCLAATSRTSNMIVMS